MIISSSTLNTIIHSIIHDLESEGITLCQKSQVALRKLFRTFLTNKCNIQISNINSAQPPIDITELQRLLTLYQARVITHVRREKIYLEALECLVCPRNTLIFDRGEDVTDIMEDVSALAPLAPIEHII